jgi:hypothetical protein
VVNIRPVEVPRVAAVPDTEETPIEVPALPSKPKRQKRKPAEPPQPASSSTARARKQKGASSQMKIETFLAGK